ncbi:MAG TPA: hypothetical protein H9769_06140, partial [Candidatus Microbacterium pullistercoris]|nr:hypothetical protein [Candidatus Microbacterium pullistercoris]
MAIRRVTSGLVAAILLAGVVAVAPHPFAAPAAATATAEAPDSSDTAPPVSADPNSSRPIYRFWSEGYGNAHFYTIDHAAAQ